MIRCAVVVFRPIYSNGVQILGRGDCVYRVLPSVSKCRDWSLPVGGADPQKRRSRYALIETRKQDPPYIMVPDNYSMLSPPEEENVKRWWCKDPSHELTSKVELTMLQPGTGEIRIAHPQDFITENGSLATAFNSETFWDWLPDERKFRHPFLS